MEAYVDVRWMWCVEGIEMFRSAQRGQQPTSLEKIVFPMMVARFQTVLSTSTQTITFHTTTSIPKVRIPLHEQFLTHPTTQIAAYSGSVVQLTRLVSLSAPHVHVWTSLMGSMIQNATTNARVNKDFNGHSPLTKSKSLQCNTLTPTERILNHRQVPFLAGRTDLRLAH